MATEIDHHWEIFGCYEYPKPSRKDDDGSWLIARFTVGYGAMRFAGVFLWGVPKAGYRISFGTSRDNRMWITSQASRDALERLLLDSIRIPDRRPSNGQRPLIADSAPRERTHGEPDGHADRSASL
jgi:hypothetical protein